MKYFRRTLLFGLLGLSFATMIRRRWTRRKQQGYGDASSMTKRPTDHSRPLIRTVVSPRDELAATLLAEFSPSGFDGVGVIPLEPLPGGVPLWAAFTTGFRDYSIKPLPSHVVAVYRLDNGQWHEITRQELNCVFPDGRLAPDVLDNMGVSQVPLEPNHLWLETRGTVGAHQGSYVMFMFDNGVISPQAVSNSVTPDSGYAEDINGDGVQEVILNRTDPYVFGYGSGVEAICFILMRWDSAAQRLVEVDLTPLPEDTPEGVHIPANQAVKFARAGLWKDAKTQVDAARQAAASVTGFDPNLLNWLGVLIDRNAAEHVQDVASSSFPLIANVFYGDYPTAADLLRVYQPDQIFSAHPVIVMNTPAEGFEDSLSQRVCDCADFATAVKPDLAAAFFLRGWAEFLANPVKPSGADNVNLATFLAPADAFYKSCLDFLLK